MVIILWYNSLWVVMRNRNFFILLIILFICSITLICVKLFWLLTDTESDKIYRQGLEFYNKADYQNAYYNFKKISFLSSYSIPALYRQATCAYELNDRKTAIKKYSKFAKIYKNTNLAPEALWKIALLEIDAGEKKKANFYLNKLVEKYPKSDFAKAASYKLGLFYLDNKEPNKAKDYLIEYIEYAPTGRYAIEVLSLLQNYDFNKLSVSDKYYIADALYQNGKYSRSVEILTEVPFENSWLLLAKNYDKLSDFNSFADTLLKGVSLKYKNQKFEEKDILDTMALYVKKSAVSKQAAYNLVLNTKNNTLYPLSLFLYARYVDYDSSIKNYEKIFKDYPNSMVAPDALWFAFWHYYKAGDNICALKLSKSYTNIYFDYNIQPKIMFWTAKIHLNMGHKKIAKSILHNIATNFPDSYYAFRANAILKKQERPWSTDNKLQIKDKFSLEKFPLELDNKENRLLGKFVALNDYSVIQNFKLENDFLQSWLAAKNDRKAYSVLVARNALSLDAKKTHSPAQYKLAYPLYYRESVNNYAAKYNISPYLMLALIREESFFDNTAVSSTGAMGLMQLMPSTAKLMDARLYNTKNLFNGEYNISLGIKYFAHLMEIFNGNEPLCVLAYNSGPGSVKKWLSKFNGKDFDEFVENVPYPETANYIKKVYVSYWNYINIYER